MVKSFAIVVLECSKGYMRGDSDTLLVCSSWLKPTATKVSKKPLPTFLQSQLSRRELLLVPGLRLLLRLLLLKEGSANRIGNDPKIYKTMNATR